jgi:hypothetical protein
MKEKDNYMERNNERRDEVARGRDRGGGREGAMLQTKN